MKFLKFTYVDAVTEISVATEPARNGPKFPEVAGLTFVWARESQYPTNVPEFFGTCPDESMTAIDGVLAVLAEADFNNMRLDEMRVRKPQVISPRQARLALLGAGLLPQVDSAINGLPEPQRSAAKIEWEFATRIERTSPLVLSLGAALGLIDDQVDDLFAKASAL